VISAALASQGFAVVRDVVSVPLVALVGRAVDAAVEAERPWFPDGDPQYGRVLFAPAHGGAFLELLDNDPFFAPIEERLGECLVYTMTTSVLGPGEAGPVASFHRDLEVDRPPGIALAAMLLLDHFTADNGATEFVVGSHGDVDDARVAGDRPTSLLTGNAGDVCYFDPRVLHRTTPNRSTAARRALLVLMVKPWMKQRFDVRAMLGDETLAALPAAPRRRLGVDAVPPRSYEEFIARRDRRPWT